MLIVTFNIIIIQEPDSFLGYRIC